MPDQPLTRPQAIALIMMFTFGSSIVFGVSTGAGQDAWIALCIATGFSVPVYWIYARIISLNPGEGLFSTAERLLGRVLGKAATALMSWYALHLCALVFRNFSEFVQDATLAEAPQLPVLIVMALTVYMLARNGAKALGRWSIATMPIVLGIAILTVLLSSNIMKPEYCSPRPRTKARWRCSPSLTITATTPSPLSWCSPYSSGPSPRSARGNQAKRARRGIGTPEGAPARGIERNCFSEWIHGPHGRNIRCGGIHRFHECIEGWRGTQFLVAMGTIGSMDGFLG